MLGSIRGAIPENLNIVGADRESEIFKIPITV